MAFIDDMRSTASARLGDGVPRGHVSEIQRARIISAAIEAIKEDGYAQLTVAQIIARAKVSRKTFYDLFEDREDCFLTVFEVTLSQLSARVVDAYEAERGWRDGVRAGLAALLAFIDEDPELARLCVVDALGGGPRVLAERARVIATLRKVIDRGREVPGAKPEPPAVTAEGVIGAVLAVLHTRLLERSPRPYIELHGALMSMIVLPYLGVRAASSELRRPAPPVRTQRRGERPVAADPMAGLDMRLTYRTVRVLSAIRERPLASNRAVADGAGIADQGQISKLLSRLEGLGLIENMDRLQGKGAPNEWRLTKRGERVERATRPM
ncbi:MAG TPA: TetR/AcrR family transcriptional regulator [Solirubrobacteraceae bacterium]|jgi:AcrR family transcriptional regulator|nr:TetR/AcrR family transcriptional regulator [Solirubrobacteraceae bacterium]